MTLGAPLVLLGLLLVPALLLLERLRRRPRTVPVASLLLWREVVPDRRAPVARRRRRTLSLLLRIAAVVLLSLAGSDPALTASRPASRTLYVLVDRSPSMGADGRLARAMAVVEEAAASFERVRVLFSPPGRVLREGDDLAPPPVAAHGEPLAHAAAGLLGLAGEDPAARALLVTDRLPESLEDTPGLAVALVGRPAPNAAVTALRVDRDVGGDVVFVAWEGFGCDAPDLVLDAGSETRRPGGEGRRTAVVRLPAGVERIVARLDHAGDALAADNEARAGRASPRPSLGLIGADVPREIVLALRAVLGDGLVEGATGEGGGVAYRTVPPADAPGAWVAVRPDAPFSGFEPGAPGTEPIAVSRVVPEDPDLAPAFPSGLPVDLVLGPADGLRAPPDARVLLRVQDGPALALATADGRRVVLTFDPADSRGTFHRSGAHAVLWRVLVDRIAGEARFEVTAGVLDAQESDLRGEERPLAREALAAPVSSRTVVRTGALRLPIALAAMAAVAGLLLLALRTRREGSSC